MANRRGQQFIYRSAASLLRLLAFDTECGMEVPMRCRGWRVVALVVLCHPFGCSDDDDSSARTGTLTVDDDNCPRLDGVPVVSPDIGRVQLGTVTLLNTAYIDDGTTVRVHARSVDAATAGRETGRILSPGCYPAGSQVLVVDEFKDGCKPFCGEIPSVPLEG